jgi:hypothetical protein
VESVLTHGRTRPIETEFDPASRPRALLRAIFARPACDTSQFIVKELLLDERQDPVSSARAERGPGDPIVRWRTDESLSGPESSLRPVRDELRPGLSGALRGPGSLRGSLRPGLL